MQVDDIEHNNVIHQKELYEMKTFIFIQFCTHTGFSKRFRMTIKIGLFKALP